MRTVELLCDPALDGLVRAAWQRLHAAGLPSLATHSGATNAPHVTLGTAETLPDLGFLGAALPVPVRVAELVFFEGKAGAAAWRLESPPLVSLQADVWRALGGVGNPLHAPDAWVPHLSLARRVPPSRRADVARAVDGLAAAEGLLVTARSFDTAARTVAPIAGDTT